MKTIIEDLQFSCIIGLFKKERKNKQKIRLDMSIKAGAFVDYAKVVKVVKNLYKKEKFLLVETSLEKTAKKLKKEFPQISKINIKILKLKILKNCHVGAKFSKKY